MAQLTLYVDEKLLRQIEAEAKKEKFSVSRWVTQKLSAVLNRSWPAGFLSLAGALKDEDFHRPPQEGKVKDARKVSI